MAQGGKCKSGKNYWTGTGFTAKVETGAKKGLSALRIAAVAAIIQIEHLDFAYGEQLVLKQITLPVDAGSTLGIIGPNGGGKSTLLKLLLNIHQPTRGLIRIDGLSPADAVGRAKLQGSNTIR